VSPDVLQHLVGCGNVVVLSGAGLSTDSGIPDYRGPTGSLRRHAPMTYQAFVGDPAARHR
jgi:NAD-dependent SIR2 family protein deacetylase